jgi:hypothetical protein
MDYEALEEIYQAIEELNARITQLEEAAVAQTSGTSPAADTAGAQGVASEPKSAHADRFIDEGGDAHLETVFCKDLILHDSSGKKRMRLTLIDDELATIIAFDGEGREVARLGADPDGGSQLILSAGAAHGQIWMRVQADGSSTVKLFGPDESTKTLVLRHELGLPVGLDLLEGNVIVKQATMSPP